MRAAFLLLGALLVTGCAPNSVQQQAGFARTEIRPAKPRAAVGEIVRFDLRPPVSRGTEWDLDIYNRVRFVGGDTSPHRFWVAEHEPIYLETIVAPWDGPEGERGTDTAWLWYALRDAGEKESINRPLPVAREPYTELAPVTFVSAVSPPTEEKAPRLSYTRPSQRHEVRFKSTTDVGSPSLPKVRAALVQTGGKKILYAEIQVNFGEARKETLGYETTLSYGGGVEGAVDVVVVEWVGHGDYFGTFQVHRMNIPG
jgi:hypothetical protein